MNAQLTVPYVNTRQDEPFQFLGIPTLMRSTAETTNGAYGLMEHWSMPPGFASPYHRHHREDEAFYVLDGEMAFVCDGKWLRGGPGTYVFGPREIPHGFKVIGTTPARMLLLCAPGGFEQFVIELGQPASAPPAPPAPPDMAQLMAVAAKYEIDILGPLPEEPAAVAEPVSAPASFDGDLKSLNRRWLTAFNERDWTTERAVRGPNFRALLSGSPEPLNNEAWSGFMSAFTTAFPDAHIATDSCIAEDDTVVTLWTLTGTHKGDFQGIPATGRSVKFTGIEFNRVRDGQIIEHNAQFDNLSLLAQIGALPGAGS